MNDDTRAALQILKKMACQEAINYTKNEDLYSDYKFKHSVYSDVEEMANMFGLNIYEHADKGLFVTPGIDSEIFGYSNAELRKILKVKDNSQLSVCYFVMYNIITMFYRESSLIPIRDFINANQLLAAVNQKVGFVNDAIVTLKERGINSSEEYSKISSYNQLVSSWNDRDDENLKSKAKDTSKDNKSDAKIAYVNRTLEFFCSCDLLYYDSLRNVYMLEPRLSTLIGYFYEDKNVKGDIVRYLEENFSREEDVEDSIDDSGWSMELCSLQ